MPPPPASPLSARDIEVLERWAAMPEEGRHAPNLRPYAVLARKRLVEGNLEVTVDVFDGNGDQVLGKLTAGGVDRPITHAGRTEAVFEDVEASAPVTVTLSDGWDLTTTTF